MTEEEPGLSMEQAQSMVSWSISAGALIVLLHNVEYSDDPDEQEALMDGFKNAVEIMYHQMDPNHLEIATSVAAETLEEAEEEIALLDAFSEQLENIKPEDFEH